MGIRRCGMIANETTLLSKSKFVKVNHYRSKYGLNTKPLAHTEQQAIKGYKFTWIYDKVKLNDKVLYMFFRRVCTTIISAD